jgi:hypothetical protein
MLWGGPNFLSSSSAVAFNFIPIYGFQWFILIYFEIYFLPNQFLEIVLYRAEFSLHILEESFARVIVFWIDWRGGSPIDLVGHKELLLVEGASFLGDGGGGGMIFFESEFFHLKLILKIIRFRLFYFLLS